MPKSLAEYLDWLDERGVRRPQPPAFEPAKARPASDPIPGLKAVIWSVYGTLLRISDGEPRQIVDDEFRMQIALEKTLEEFKMWQSMTRKPGAPWKYLDRQYRDLLEELRLQAVVPKGEIPEIDSSLVWKRLIERLMKKDFEWDRSLYGDEDGLSQKMATFFHLGLQGVEAMPGAAQAVASVRRAGLVQGLLADGQCFTLVQLLRHLRGPGKLEPAGGTFANDVVVFSFREGVRKPSTSLYRTCAERLERRGIAPEAAIYVSNVLRGDMDVAKSFGFRTALLACDQLGLRANPNDLKDSSCRPDRLIASPEQIETLIGR